MSLGTSQRKQEAPLTQGIPHVAPAPGAELLGGGAGAGQARSQRKGQKGLELEPRGPDQTLGSHTGLGQSPGGLPPGSPTPHPCGRGVPPTLAPLGSSLPAGPMTEGASCDLDTGIPLCQSCCGPTGVRERGLKSCVL